MPLSEAERKKCVEILLNAEREKKQAVQLSVTYPHITIEDSYAISTAVAQHKIKGGAKLIGHKVGLTSKAMQASSQINEPDYGHLLDTMMIADGAKVPHANYCVPRVEIELAFILGKPMKGPGIGLTDVLHATEYVIPAMEIVDARIVNAVACVPPENKPLPVEINTCRRFLAPAIAEMPALTMRAVMHHASVPRLMWRSSRIGTMKIENTTGFSGAVIQFAMNDTAQIGDVLEAYERLILDAMRGDHTLFTTAEGIERLWEVSQPLLEAPPPEIESPATRGPVVPIAPQSTSATSSRSSLAGTKTR